MKKKEFLERQYQLPFMYENPTWTDKQIENNKLVGLYIHKKGGLYMVNTIAVHSETLEELVIYTKILTGEVFARPKEMFFDGRFSKVSNDVE